MLSRTKDLYLNYEPVMALFETYVKNNNVMVVKCGYYTRLMILTKFCKVYKDWNCKNGIVNIELECFPFRSTGIFRMMKSWFKLLGTANCILRSRFVNYENTNTTLYFINLFHLKRYMYIVKNCLFFLINLKSILLFHIWYINVYAVFTQTYTSEIQAMYYII